MSKDAIFDRVLYEASKTKRESRGDERGTDRGLNLSGEYGDDLPLSKRMWNREQYVMWGSEQGENASTKGHGGSKSGATGEMFPR